MLSSNGKDFPRHGYSNAECIAVPLILILATAVGAKIKTRGIPVIHHDIEAILKLTDKLRLHQMRLDQMRLPNSARAC